MKVGVIGLGSMGLGAALNLPMSSVTLFEDVLMAAMAAAMLAATYRG